MSIVPVTSGLIIPSMPQTRHDLEREQRVLVGGKECLKPYLASRLNISAMSFGSLSKNAVLAMNAGAKMGGFAQNTGEGGISPYHLTARRRFDLANRNGLFRLPDGKRRVQPRTFPGKKPRWKM